MELWDVYDINRNKTGKTAVRGEGLPEGGFHLVVHVCILGSDGRMLIQKRQPSKHGFSGMWDVSAGGSAVAGETSSDAAMREAFEEIGVKLDLNGVRPHYSVSYDEGFDDWYVVKADPDITGLKLQYEEVEAVEWATEDEIFEMMDKGEFIPYFKGYISTIFHTADQYGSIREKHNNLPRSALRG